MIAIALFVSMMAVANCGVIHHGGDDGHGSHATSYQHVKIENYHAVPVFVKKEHAQLLEHPVSAGHVDHGVKIHHGDGHHDHGYALTSGSQHDTQSNVGHLLAGNEDEGAHHEGLSAYAGHEGVAQGYESGHEGLNLGQDGGHEAASLQGYDAHQGGYAALESHGQHAAGGGYGGNALHGHGSYESAGHGGHY